MTTVTVTAAARLTLDPFSNGNVIDHLARLDARIKHCGGRHRAENVGAFVRAIRNPGYVEAHAKPEVAA